MLNQNSILLLSAKLSMPPNSKLNTSWSVDITDVDLSYYSLTPVKLQFDTSNEVLLNLPALPSHSLQVRVDIYEISATKWIGSGWVFITDSKQSIW